MKMLVLGPGLQGSVTPRDVFIAAVGPKLRKPEGRDLVALPVEVAGTKAGAPCSFRWQLVDYDDTDRGISAMMRTTGYSPSITGQMQGDGRITPGGPHAVRRRAVRRVYRRAGWTWCDYSGTLADRLVLSLPS